MTKAPRLRAVEVAAQAKINLRLRILAREASGYHQLETLFLRLELADTVRVRMTPRERTLDVSGDDLAALGPVEKNLAWRAAEAYLAAAEERRGFAIELTKRIPIGGGLGGGSADAGAVLRALDAMIDEPLGAPRLLDLAHQLGADVPFLTTEHAYALAWGRGERMLALTAPPSRPATLIVPSFGVSTAEAFGWLAEMYETIAPIHATPGLVLDPAALSDWDALEPFATNDFLWAVEERHPLISTYLSMLHSLGMLALMTGSGSTCVGIGGLENGDLVWQRVDGTPVEEGRVILTRTAARVEPLLPIE